VSDSLATDFLDDLVRQFYDDPSELGRLERCHDSDVPEPYAHLLLHQHHMTVTLEEYHGALVDVHVLERHQQDEAYSRKILLSRQSDDAIVMFGLVRIRLGLVEPAPRELILGEQVPLGRILIEHNILRRVHLHWLLKIDPGPDLARLLKLQPGEPAWGRTAVIWLNGASAIELLEVVPTRPAN
jgi:chorismate-pyruvate lyase